MASREAVKRVIRDVFGTVSRKNSDEFRLLQKPLKGTYISRYYPEPIETFARKIMPEYKTDEEERRSKKLQRLRMRGKGPPKKGQGKRNKKK